MNKFPMKLPAIKVEQPLGDFYVVSIPAEVLLEVCYTIRAEILDGYEDQSISHVGTFINKLVGNQRVTTRSRLEEIKRYTETVDASFPNSIILGVNYSSNGTLVTDEAVRWDIEQKDNGFYYLTIPTGEKLASIIDGQHRVFGFTNSNCKDMELLCSVYLDLPLAYHGRIFTNININQRRVDKNLAYNLFQFDMEQGEPSSSQIILRKSKHACIPSVFLNTLYFHRLFTMASRKFKMISNNVLSLLSIYSFLKGALYGILISIFLSRPSETFLVCNISLSVFGLLVINDKIPSIIDAIDIVEFEPPFTTPSFIFPLSGDFSSSDKTRVK
ncbi:DGQHR domain-containing protein [Escherichia fergusonii]|uniref:DGQHR domain-containing protein n=1 Tax=Escherichia fergusonii TaxID=564 RepID=UPI003EDEAD81